MTPPSREGSICRVEATAGPGVELGGEVCQRRSHVEHADLAHLRGPPWACRQLRFTGESARLQSFLRRRGLAAPPNGAGEGRVNPASAIASPPGSFEPVELVGARSYLWWGRSKRGLQGLDAAATPSLTARRHAGL